MSVYLITGLGGSGKSTIASTLQQRGFAAFDSDAILGLARWEDAITGAPIAVDYTGFVDYQKVAWNWNGAVLQKFIAAHADKPFFLCGSASNQKNFYKLFSQVFVLALSPSTHRHRLQNRASDYGKHPDMLKKLVADHQTFLKDSVLAGAISVAAEGSPADTVDKILAYVHLV